MTKLNSSTIVLTKESSEFQSMENQLKKIAKENGINNVSEIAIKVSKGQSLIKFKKANENEFSDELLNMEAEDIMNSLNDEENSYIDKADKLYNAVLRILQEGKDIDINDVEEGGFFTSFFEAFAQEQDIGDMYETTYNLVAEISSRLKFYQKVKDIVMPYALYLEKEITKE